MNRYYHLKYKNDPKYVERNRERARNYYRMHSIEILSKRKNRSLTDKNYAAHESARALKYYKQKRNLIITQLGSRCNLCGYQDPKIQIHHIARRNGKKKATVEEMREGKIVLLCRNCHHTITRLVFWKNIGAFDRAFQII